MKSEKFKDKDGKTKAYQPTSFRLDKHMKSKIDDEKGDRGRTGYAREVFSLTWILVEEGTATLRTKLNRSQFKIILEALKTQEVIKTPARFLDNGVLGYAIEDYEGNINEKERDRLLEIIFDMTPTERFALLWTINNTQHWAPEETEKAVRKFRKA